MKWQIVAASRFGWCLVAIGIVAPACSKDVDEGDAGTLDPTMPAFTKLLVPGVCRVNPRGDPDPELNSVRMTFLMLNGQDDIEPDDMLQRQVGNVRDNLTPDKFNFRKPAALDVAEGAEGNAVAEGDVTGTARGFELAPISNADGDPIDFRYLGGEVRARVLGQDTLVVILMDQSGSLVGRDPRSDSAPDLDKAADKNDQRISFMQQFVRNLPEDDFVSLISFKGATVVIDPDVSKPTRDHDVIVGNTNDGVASLQSLNLDEEGFAPVAQALDDAFERIIKPNDDLIPVVVLFTDIAYDAGEDDLDTSATADLQSVTEKYRNPGAFEYRPEGVGDAEDVEPIPVMVLHLRQNLRSGLPRERHRDLVDLACATGGDYIFLESADELTDGTTNLQPMLRNRIHGVWDLNLDPTALRSMDFPPDGYRISTEVQHTMGEAQQTASLAKPRDDIEFKDTRLWLYK